MSIWLLTLLVWTHFIADFVLQTDKMALNKSKSNYCLFIHVAVYSTVMLVFGWKFALTNFVLHYIVDWGTSRWSTYLWNAGKRQLFFIIVGLDQSIHITFLLITAQIFDISSGCLASQLLRAFNHVFIGL